MSGLQDYLDATGHLPEDALLGHIAFTTGSDGEHDREALVAQFQRLGLDESKIPGTSTAFNAFKKAVTRAQDVKYALGPGSEASVQFRELASANPAEIVTRVIMREIRVDSQQKIGWESVGELRLYRAPRVAGHVDESKARLAVLLGDGLSELENARLKRILADINHDYQRYRTFLDGQQIRYLLLDYIRSLSGVPVLRHATHFVPIKYADELRRLAEATSTLKDCRITLIPLVDLGDQRELIQEAFRTEHESDLTGLLEDIAKEKDITPAIYARLRRRYDRVTGRAQHYEEILDTSIAKTSGQLDLVTRAMAQLGQRLLEKGDAR